MSAYRSGQRIRISDDVADVVHEFGCRWTAGDGTAEAWVFVPPVTRERAAGLVRDGCRGVDGPAFGDPSVACRTEAAGSETFTFRGLFGDAWLSCRLTLGTASQDETAGPSGSLVRRRGDRGLNRLRKPARGFVTGLRPSSTCVGRDRQLGQQRRGRRDAGRVVGGVVDRRR